MRLPTIPAWFRPLQRLLDQILAVVGRGAEPRCRKLTLCLWLVRLLTGPVEAAEPAPTFKLPAGDFDLWIPHGPERNWSGLASSADGRLLAATAREDRIHTSSDYGETWVPRGAVQAWQAIASSADGQHLVAVVDGGRIHTSNDAGATWIERESSRKWSAVASSHDGLRLAATVDGGRIHISTNAGVSWSEVGPVQAWSAITSSADGRKLAATVFDGPIQVSIDGGQTWSVSGPVKFWKAITSSADGTRLAAAVWEGRINTSTNSALTWTEWDSNPPGQGGRLHRWRAIACPADGGIFMAASVPMDSGWAGHGRLAAGSGFVDAWEEQGQRTRWSAIACSADGLRWVAAVEGKRLHLQGRTTSHHTVDTSIISGAVSIPQFATGISPGRANADALGVRFSCTANDPSLFTVQPSIRTDGTLEFTPGTRPGRTVVTVIARDEGGASVSAAQSFSIQIQGRTFVANAWTNDASSGISRSETLWGYRFAPATNPPSVINDVVLPVASGASPDVPGRFSFTGPDNQDQPYTFLTAQGGNGSARLGGSYLNGFFGMQLKLEGLTPGIPYTIHVYSTPTQDRVAQTAEWSAPTGVNVIDGGQFGTDWGIRVSHAFVPTESTYRINVNPLVEARWNWHGLALNSTPATASMEQPLGSPLPSSASRSFGALSLGTASQLVFTVRNSGMVPLKDFVFTRSGDHPEDFEVVAQPTESIPGSTGSATFAVEFSPTGLGPRSATLLIGSNATNSLILHLTGTGQPEAATLVHDIPDQEIPEDGRTDALPFELGDPASGEAPTLVARSSDPLLVPHANIVITGTGSRRSVVVTPAPDRFGSALIRIRARQSGREICHIFRVTVNPVNDPPRFRIPEGTPIPLGTEWQSRGPRSDWRAIVASYDGQRMAAVVHHGQIHTSTNAGATWTPHGEKRAWSAVASSTNGMRLTATVAGGQIYNSRDGGFTWNPNGPERDWISVAGSADGTRLVAAVNGGQLYTSQDGGTSWIPRERNREWRSVACSADGLRIVAAPANGSLILSEDGGETWSQRGSANNWTCVSCSEDGRHLAASATDGPLFVSADAGATWEPRASARFWNAVAGSADGRILAATETLGQVWVSTDFGTNWTAGGGTRDGSGLTVSGDGRILATPDRGGPIQVSSTRIEPYTLNVGANSGLSVTRGFLTDLSPGPQNEAAQRVRLSVTNDRPSLFLSSPEIDSTGTLTFTPSDQSGVAVVRVIAGDDGGTQLGGRNTSEPHVFQVRIHGSGFSHRPWTDDASTGINRAATLWAYRFGEAQTNEIVVQGVRVPLLSGMRPQVAGHFALVSVGGAQVDENALSPIRGGASLAGGFVVGGRPSHIVLEDLVPGTAYTLYCFGVGSVHPTPRLVTWTSGDDVAVVDEQTYGPKNGIRLAYSFTADAATRRITASGDYWHFFGLALNAPPPVLVLETLQGKRLSPDSVFNMEVSLGKRGENGEQTFVLRNEGFVPLGDVVVTVNGPNASDFTLTPPFSPNTATRGERMTFSIRFTPSGTGSRTATLNIASNDPRPRPFVVQLVGTGLTAPTNATGTLVSP